MAKARQAHARTRTNKEAIKALNRTSPLPPNHMQVRLMRTIHHAPPATGPLQPPVAAAAGPLMAHELDLAASLEVCRQVVRALIRGDTLQVMPQVHSRGL